MCPYKQCDVFGHNWLIAQGFQNISNSTDKTPTIVSNGIKTLVYTTKSYRLH